MENKNLSGIEGAIYRSRHSSGYFKKRLEWVGHVVRMDQGGAVKKFDCKVGGK
jgi:hypothetical protein